MEELSAFDMRQSSLASFFRWTINLKNASKQTKE